MRTRIEDLPIEASQGAGRCDPTRLLALMHAGDIRALDEISKCFGRQMFRIGRARCGSVDQARDAVQDAMLAAGQNLRQYRGDGPVVGWLMRMVINACHHLRRGRKNDPALHQPIDEAAERFTLHGPEHDLRRKELRDELDRAMQVLSPADRSLVMLADTMGWNGPELAAEFGYSPAAVRARLSRARHKLRAALSDAWRDFDPGLPD